jgi:RecA/RadA recombinase
MKISDVLKSIKKNTGAVSIMESPIAKVSDFISTGSYAINRILSGNIYNGIPVGRITTIAGESQAGKSLLAANVVIEALKNNKVDYVIYFDTEGGVPVDYIEQSGVDMDRVQYIPTKSLETCGAKLIETFENLCKMKDEYDKDPENNELMRVLVVLDSIGGLSTDKLIADSEKKGVMIPDMGQAAKTRNNLMRGLMMRVPMSGSTLVIVNHIYDDTNAGMYGVSKIKNMGGGRQIEYSSHVILQCEKLLIKSSNEDYQTGMEKSDDKNGFYKGNRLTFFVRKSRIVKPFNQAQVYLSLEYGSNKWWDLIEPATTMGFIEPVRGGYLVPSYSDKKITEKELITNDAIWKTFIGEFNKKSEQTLCYKNKMSDEVDKLLGEE